MPVVFNPFTGNLDLIDNTAAAGSNTQVQFNDGGVLGGDSGLVFNKTTNALTGGAFIPTSSTVPTNGVYLPGANQLGLSTSGTGRLFVDASGRVGIGVETPATDLHISSSTPGLTFTDTDTGADHRINANSGAGNFAIEVDANSETSTPSLIANIKGSERLRITSAGLVGIGTSSPDTELEVVATAPEIKARATGNNTGKLSTDSNRAASVTGGQILSRWNGNTVARIDFINGADGTNKDDGEIAFATANDASNPLERMRITQAGNVGIGTQSPLGILHVKSGTAGGTDPTIAANSIFEGEAAVSLMLNSTDSSTQSIYFRDASTAGNSFRGAARYTHSDDALALFTAGLERCRLDSSGRLLVGASSNYSPPSQNLIAQFNAVNNAAGGIAVNNWSIAGAATGGRISLTRANAVTVGTFTACSASAQYGQIDFWGSDGTKFVEAARITANPDGTPGTDDMPGRLVFSTTADGASSPTERMRITKDGSTLIGTTSPVDVTTGTEDGFTAYSTGATHLSRSGAVSLWLRRRTSNGTVAVFYRDAAQVGTISVTTTATAYNTSSDYRLKENVTAVTDGITRLQQLKPSRFNFIADPDTTVDGFLAHEVQAIVPEAITGEKDEVDEDGNPQYQGIDQSKLVPLLTAALQEAIGEIESLKARVAALETP